MQRRSDFVLTYSCVLVCPRRLEKKAEKLRKSLTRIVLKDVLEKIIVKESISLEEGKIRLYELRLHYLPKKSYSGSTNVSPQRILKFVETKLLSRLDQMLKKNLKKSYTQQNLILDDGTSKRKGPRRNEEEEGDEGPEEDVDTNTVYIYLGLLRVHYSMSQREFANLYVNLCRMRGKTIAKNQI